MLDQLVIKRGRQLAINTLVQKGMFSSREWLEKAIDKKEIALGWDVIVALFLLTANILISLLFEPCHCLIRIGEGLYNQFGRFCTIDKCFQIHFSNDARR